jgi:hypothetical protein
MSQVSYSCGITGSGFPRMYVKPDGGPRGFGRDIESGQCAAACGTHHIEIMHIFQYGR